MAEPNEPAPQTPATEDDLEIEPPLPVRSYILLNVIFWAFCIVEIVLVRWWIGEIQGVIFFFLLLAIGFTVVSIYDAVYDRIRARRRDREIEKRAVVRKASKS